MYPRSKLRLPDSLLCSTASENEKTAESSSSKLLFFGGKFSCFSFFPLLLLSFSGMHASQQLAVAAAAAAAATIAIAN